MSGREPGKLQVSNCTPARRRPAEAGNRGRDGLVTLPPYRGASAVPRFVRPARSSSRTVPRSPSPPHPDASPRGPLADMAIALGLVAVCCLVRGSSVLRVSEGRRRAIRVREPLPSGRLFRGRRGQHRARSFSGAAGRAVFPQRSQGHGDRAPRGLRGGGDGGRRHAAAPTACGSASASPVTTCSSRSRISAGVSIPRRFRGAASASSAWCSGPGSSGASAGSRAVPAAAPGSPPGGRPRGNDPAGPAVPGKPLICSRGRAFPATFRWGIYYSG
jgi:hypothetical protein